jgi:tetratricopeptide (TPR) repeat protein
MWRWLVSVLIVIALSLGVGAWARDRWMFARDAEAARAAIFAGRAERAREPLLRWLGRQPSSAEAHALLAQVALAQGDLGEVTREMTEARALGYPHADLERLHAICLARVGRYAEAEPILTRLWGAAPRTDPAVAEALARIYLRTYRLRDADAVIRRWIDGVPADGRPFVWLTEIDRRIEVDNPASWEQHYREALRRDPELAAARLGLAETLRKLHRPNEAAAEYERYLAGHPADQAALVGAGRNALEQGDLSEASRLLERSLAMTPDDAGALKGKAELDLRRGELGSALRQLDRAIQSDPFDHEALHRRAMVRTILGDPAGAQADRSAFDRLKNDQAELLKLREAVLDDPNNDDARSHVAAWMFAHGREQEGVGWAQAVLTKHPNHAPTCRLLADYHARRPSEAGLANFYRLQATGPDSNSR